MLRIAKIVVNVIYKNSMEENSNRFSCCSEYTYRLRLMPWVAKVQSFLLFCAGVGRGESGNAIPPIFPRQCCVFYVDSPRNSLSAMFVYFYHTHINFEIATLATNDMWPYSQFSMSGLAGLRAAAFIFTFTHWESNEVNESGFVPGTLEIYGLLRIK